MTEKRILIADADPKAWDVFRQSLGQSWRVVGASTGEAAVAEAQKEPFEAIVANFDLPGLGGAELLNRLRVAHPKTLRFIAAAESVRGKAVCQVVGSHQFLPIPFDPSTLKGAMERSLAEDYGMSQSMRELVGRIRTFPAIPSLYLEVVKALKDPNATTEDIGIIIGQDMAMTTKLVQVLNSAFYGLPRTITDPTEAVGLLGFETVKSLIMTVKLLSQYDKVKPVYFSIDTIWRHSTNVAHTAKAIARLETGDTECSGHAYTAGLMHDLGKVILAANFDEQYTEAHAVARRKRLPLWEAEKEILGASHGEIGAYLLGLWGMSEEIVKVAALHHQPLRAGDRAFSALTAVHVANALEYECEPNPDGLALAMIDTAYLQQLGLEERIEHWRRLRRNPEDTKFETKIQRAKAAAKAAAKLANPAPAPASENSLPTPATNRGAGVPPAGSGGVSPPVPNSLTHPSLTLAPDPARVPEATKFAPAALPPGPPPWRLFLKWGGLGLGVATALALVACLEIMRLQKLAEKHEREAVGEQLPPVKYEMADVTAPAQADEEPPPEPAPAPAPPTHVASEVAVPVPAPSPAVPAPAPVALPAPAKSALDRLKLQAIFFSAQHPSALINGQMAEVNQKVAECRVLDISPSSVTLEYQHQRRTLNIR
jgi:putative nucleotidyltransferase with HDIG domain